MALPLVAALQLAGVAAQGAGMLQSFGAQRKATKQIAGENARRLDVSRAEFDKRMSLTDTLNALLLGNEDRRFREATTNDNRTRADIGDQSVARFDEQAAAVSGQTDFNRTAADAFMARLEQALSGAIGFSDAERGRQEGFRAEADTARDAVLPQVGSVADALARAGISATRGNNALTTMAPSSAGGYAPGASSLVQAAFANEANDATANAEADALAAADAASYGDARGKEVRTLAGFNSLIDRLKRQSEISNAALAPELASMAAQGSNAQAKFVDDTTLAAQDADGRIRISDRDRTGRIANLDDAGAREGDSIASYFSRIADNARTGYGGQVDASANYEGRLSSIIDERIAAIQGKAANAGKTLTSLGSLVSAGAGALQSGGGFRPSFIPAPNRIPQLPSPTSRLPTGRVQSPIVFTGA